MKKLIITIMLLLTVSLLTLTLSACEEIPDKNISVFSINESSLEVFYDIGSFDIETVEIVIVYSDKTNETIRANKDMLSESDLALLDTEGVHVVTLTIEEVTIELTIHIVDLETLSHSIEQMFLPLYDELNFLRVVKNLTYEEWMQSINTPSSTSGMIIELFTDDNDMISWKYKGETESFEIVSLDDLVMDYSEYSNEAYQYFLSKHDEYSKNYDEWLTDTLNQRIEDIDTNIVCFLTNFDPHNCQIVVHETNTKLAEPDIENREGYTFNGWFTSNEDFEQIPWDFENKELTEDTIIFGAYIPIEYTLTLIDDSEYLETEILKVYYGSTVVFPNINRTGYTFLGWFTEDDVLIDGENWAYTNDVTLYAKWREGEETGVLDTLPSEAIEIEFWHTYSGSKSVLLNQMISEFKTLYPNVTINSSSQASYGDLNRLMRLSMAAGYTPDIIMGYPIHIEEYKQRGAVISLNDYINHHYNGIDTSDYLGMFYDEALIDGELYSVPFTKSTEVVVYNKTLFEDQGFVFEENHLLTWDELELISNTMVGSENDQCEFLINYDSEENLFINSSIQYGAGYSNSNGDILINNAETIELLEYFSNLVDNNTLAIPIEWDRSYGSHNFLEEDVCMTVTNMVGVRFNNPKVTNPSEDLFEIGILQLPQFSEKTNSTLTFGPNLAITSNTSDAERLASWLFMEYITNSENTARWAIDTGYLPVTQSGIDTDIYQEYLNTTDTEMLIYAETARVAIESLEYAHYEPVFINNENSTSENLRDEVSYMFSTIYVGSKTVEEALADLIENLNN